MQTITEALAATLRAEKAAAGLSNDELAERAGIPVVSVQRYLAGKRELTTATLSRLAHAIGVSASFLMVSAEQRMTRQPPPG